MLGAVALAALGAAPHIISILQDDLGFYDAGFANPTAAAYSQNITQLAKEGIRLTHHYTHWHCSPTRRSFLSGRLPIHHGEQLSANSGDDIDLRMTWISAKLKGRGYQTYWFGKEHTGFRSFHQLGANQGFDHTVGSLQTGGSYSGPKHSTRWEDDHPFYTDAELEDQPDTCLPSLEEEDGKCATSVLQDKELPCGTAKTFHQVDTWEECCALCTGSCTHWVFKPTDTAPGSTPPCHIKEGKSDCEKSQAGATSGVNSSPSPPAPGPSPSSSAVCANEYSTDLWGALAVKAVQNHDVTKPIYVHLCFEAVHTPYDKAPGDPTGSVYHGMLWRSDVYIGQMVTVLKQKSMWDNTLILYSADNGGVGLGINYPLRGEKHSSWEGGMRTAAFVSGGLIPKALWGTNNSVNMHIVDWYPTFCNLAGADPTDSPAVAPLPTDPANPRKNIYGNDSYPALDGVDVWDILMNPAKHPEPDAAHKYLVLSKEVIIAGKYKLLVSQPHFKTQNCGWKQPDGHWEPSNDDDWPCNFQDVSPEDSALPVPHPGKRPCLFDVQADWGERTDLALANPKVVQDLWAALNSTILTQRDCQGWSGPVAGPNGTCSPAELIGNCTAEAKKCATAKWKTYGGSGDGPQCGVPGC